MPESEASYVWWAFNGVLLVLLWMIRTKLNDIAKELRSNRNFTLWLVNAVIAMKTRCGMLHPHEPPLNIPDPPQSD